MMRFTVSGADRATGRDASLVIDADSAAAAERLAARTLMVAEVALVQTRAAPATCGNCDAPIGRLEPRHAWQGHWICAACYARIPVAVAGAAAPATALPYAAPPAAAAPAPRGKHAPAGPAIICPNPQCRYQGPSARRAKGSAGMAILLLALWIIPGLIYMLVYHGYRLTCPRCGMFIRDEQGI